MRNHARTTLLALACACAAACGGSGSAASSQQPARGPVIAATVASALASRADAVAASLDARRGCAARVQARQLTTAVDAAIAAGQIPAALQPQLRTAAAALPGRIACTPPHRFVPPGLRRHSHGRGHGNGQNSQGQGGD